MEHLAPEMQQLLLRPLELLLITGAQKNLRK